ncbi:ester cyclase [Planotetraspora phitsanulokensis]|nr:ester cyclase [Planotetraspora phitsanulokensis]
MSSPWGVKHQLADAINAHDVNRALEYFSPDAVVVSPSGVAEGREQIAWLYEQLFKGFPDFTLTTWNEVSDTDAPMVAEWVATGTHTGPFLLPDGSELEGTGRRITIRGACASFVENGRITTHREYFDQLEMYTQLGLGLARVEQAPSSYREELAPHTVS